MTTSATTTKSSSGLARASRPRSLKTAKPVIIQNSRLYIIYYLEREVNHYMRPGIIYLDILLLKKFAKRLLIITNKIINFEFLI